MSKSKSNSDLLVRLGHMQDGDAKHAGDNPLPTEIRGRLDASQASLEAALSRTQAARAAYHEATQAQRSIVADAREIARAVRRVVFAKYTDKDKVVEDYGFSTRAPRRKKETPKDAKKPEA